MSDHIRQSLSNLMDNEADELELRRALKACDEQEEAVECWHRYHLMRSVMHKELEQETLFDISARVSAAIANEPAPELEQPKVTSSWKDRIAAISDGWAAKGAIAASVAAAVVFLMPTPDAGQPSMLATQEVSSYQQSLPSRGLQQSPIGIQRVSAGAVPAAPQYRMAENQKYQQEALIRGYLMQHSEYVAANGTHGMMPMARVAGYQAGQQ
ncbi:sigma-E factor negative regulatory protein [Oceanospirillum beijerinckii]|uniref:sigma-E factor negative regulatory protein n=1 Tax=Oceanospirillum beijerinckii TaxID=64976 RepID=UPI000427D437|nr:sigma-E factor negative regulatory protein [Oceanospirillum beijerinckii]